MKKRLMMILLVSLPLVLFFLYVYPIQKELALKSFYRYIELQGADIDQVYGFRIFKDYTQGGYDIILKYKDDIPSNIYEYDYLPYIIGDKYGSIIFNYMCLSVTCGDIKYSPEEIYEGKNGIKVKYPPLKDYR